MKKYRVSIGKWSVVLQAFDAADARVQGIRKYLGKRPDLTVREVEPYTTVRLITGKKPPFQKGGRL